MATLFATQLLVDLPSLGWPLLSIQHDVLRLTVDWPHNYSISPSDFILRIIGARSPLVGVIGRGLRECRTTTPSWPVTIWSEINFHSTSKKEVRLPRVWPRLELDVGRKVLVDLEVLVWATEQLELVGAVLSWASSVKLYNEANRFWNLNLLALWVLILRIWMRSLKDSLSGKVNALIRQSLKSIKQINAALLRLIWSVLILLVIKYSEGLLEQLYDIDEAWQ